MIEIGNIGEKIVSTNYFESEMAAQGLFFLSWNAGTARLLVPKSREDMLHEMHPEYVIISRGSWTDQGRDGIEILFEDRTDSPFCLHLSLDQTDRTLPETDQGGGFSLVVYTDDYKTEGPVCSWPAKYRKVAEIPCLQEWAEQ